MAFAFFYPHDHTQRMKRYAYLSKWISLVALAVLAVACFLPWAYYSDLGKSFTGFFSENNAYGKPAKLLLILGSLATVCAFIPRIWPKRLSMFTSAFMVAYAVNALYRYVRCYGGTCPEVRIGLILMLVSTLLIFLAALSPEGTVPAEKKDQPAEQP